MKSAFPGRIFPAHIHAISSVLEQVFKEGQRPDIALENALKGLHRPGARDRALVAESAYMLIRHWRFWWHQWGQEPQSDNTSLRKLTTHFLEFRHSLEKKGQALARWYSYQKSHVAPAVFYSLPDEAWDLGEQWLGERWIKEVEAQNASAPPHVRVNLLRTTLENLYRSLENEGITSERHPLSPHALIVTGNHRNIFRTKAFKQGWMEMQDAGSQAVSLFAAPQPGQRVVDACAGAGGKTLHMAMLMENKGRIIALDIYEHKLKELRRRCSRAGADIVETRVAATSKIIKRLHETADLVLVDAPCSGSGTWRRNPDLKYRLSNAWLNQCLKTQAEVLRTYAPLVRPGGKLVYATCSILPPENQLQWESFLKDFPAFEHEDDRTLLPSHNACDGFFMASARRR